MLTVLILSERLIGVVLELLHHLNISSHNPSVNSYRQLALTLGAALSVAGG